MTEPVRKLVPAGRLNRWLKNVASAAKARRQAAKKRSLHLVNEHSEPVANAGLASAAVFRLPVKWLVSGPPFLFLLLFFVIPSIIMVLASFRYPGEFGGLAPLSATDPAILQGVTLETYRFFFSDPIYSQVFVKSLVMALATTLICLAMAYPLALLIARSPKKAAT